MAGTALLSGDVWTTNLLTFYGCATLMLLVGLLDDRFDLNWKVRIGAQALAAVLMVLVAGLSVQHVGDVVGVPGLTLGWLALPVSIFIVVGVINALNMSDGSDGLDGRARLSRSGHRWRRWAARAAQRRACLGAVRRAHRHRQHHIGLSRGARCARSGAVRDELCGSRNFGGQLDAQGFMDLCQSSISAGGTVRASAPTRSG